MCCIKFWCMMQLPLSVCYGWFFNSTYISFPARMLSLAVLAKSEDHRVFTTLWYFSSVRSCSAEIMSLWIIFPLLFWKLYQYFLVYQQKIIPFALYETKYMCCLSATVYKDKHWSRVTLDALFIEKEKHCLSGTA